MGSLHCQAEKITDKLKNGAFWGMCYAGIEEYVFPVKVNDELICFVSVSGYGVDVEKAVERINSVSEKYMLSRKKLLECYEENLIHKKPELNEVSAVIKPLCYMILHLEQCYNSANLSGDTYSKIIEYINRNFQNKITLSELSVIANCSKSLISHMFKKRSGCNINDYINRIRIINAKSLLLNTSLSIKEIASITGFSDSNYFTNTFKKYCGCSPTAFKSM